MRKNNVAIVSASIYKLTSLQFQVHILLGEAIVSATLLSMKAIVSAYVL
jgi:hypothetical protein